MPVSFARACGALSVMIAATVAPAALAAGAGLPGVDIEGFSPAGALTETQLEQRFDAELAASDLRGWMQQMSAAPNHVGSAHDKLNAEFELAKFREWGWDAAIETFSVLYPTPKEVLVELIEPTHFKARLSEPAVEGDATSAQTKDELPAYNVYGADGDVTGELIYVNQGMPDDYKELERLGVSVKGRIVITRYGGGWRGLKPKLAYEHGAIGCLIYSDPRDDGYGAGDTYPKGGFRPRDGVQRGSVQDMTLYSGDPLTPGVGATSGRQAAGHQGCENHLEDSGIAHFVCGCRAAARGTGRPGCAGVMARRPADDLPRGSGSGESASESVVRLDAENTVRRGCETQGQR